MSDLPETTRTYVLADRPEGRPDEDDFSVEETSLPEPGPGEVAVRTLYVSVDPYMRGRMRAAESYAEPWEVGDPVPAHGVGEVVASGHGGFEPGDLVVGVLRWAEHVVVGGHRLRAVDPDLAPPPAWLGVLGMPGRTAYFGTLDVCGPRPGDTAVVSAAAGAVGSVAGQVAGMAGCRVVGVAGSDEKTDVLTGEFGFDAALNYREVDVAAALDDVCPDGVDVYFDNVGGEITDAVFGRLSVGSRVAICGQIALYNATERSTGPRKLGRLIETRGRVEGFLVGDYTTRYEEANRRLGRWVADGDLVHRETVLDGFDRVPEAFLGLFDGINVGKLVVRVGDRTGE